MKLSPSAAEAIAIDALTFITSDDELLSRVVALTGLDPAGIRAETGRFDLLRGVMHHVVEHEDLLIAFASSAGLNPEQVAAAAQALGVVWD